MSCSTGAIEVSGAHIPVLAEHDPAAIDWGELGADIVIESTGRFRARDAAAVHFKGGARKVLLSAPGKGADVTIDGFGEAEPVRARQTGLSLSLAVR